MNAYVRIAIGAAAVVVVALVAINLLPRSGGIGGQLTPVPTVVPSAAPVPSPTGPPDLTIGPIPAGTYTVSTSTDTLRPYTVTVPAGWTLDSGGFIVKGTAFEGSADATGVAFSTWIISHVYADSCRWEGTLRGAGSRQLLATGLAEQQGHTTVGPTEVTLDTFPASRLVLSVAADFDPSACGNRVLRLWPDPGPDETGGHRIFPGQTTTVYAIEDAGRTMAVFTVSNEGSPPGDVAELQGILDSVLFLP